MSWDRHDTRDILPYTCGDVDAEADEVREALKDAENALQIAKEKLEAMSAASEKGRAALRDGWETTLAESKKHEERADQAEKELAAEKNDNNDMAQQIRELEARVQELENQ